MSDALIGASKEYKRIRAMVAKAEEDKRGYIWALQDRARTEDRLRSQLAAAQRERDREHAETVALLTATQAQGLNRWREAARRLKTECGKSIRALRDVVAVVDSTEQACDRARATAVRLEQELTQEIVGRDVEIAQLKAEVRTLLASLDVSAGGGLSWMRRAEKAEARASDLQAVNHDLINQQKGALRAAEKAALMAEVAKLNAVNHELLDRIAGHAELEKAMAAVVLSRDLAQRRAEQQGELAVELAAEVAALREVIGRMGTRWLREARYYTDAPELERTRRDWAAECNAALAIPSPLAEAMVDVVKAADRWETAADNLMHHPERAKRYGEFALERDNAAGDLQDAVLGYREVRDG